LFPLLSVTVHLTVVVPIGKAGGASFVTDATPQLSAVTGVPRITPVAVQPVLVVAVRFIGPVMVGNVISVVVPTITVACLVQPFPSVAVIE
jgi:hypothetical protein